MSDHLSKGLRFETAHKSPIYAAIKEKAVDALTDSGKFHKESILEACNYEAIADAIRWDYVIKMIQLDYGNTTELYPMSEAFFKRHAKEREVSFPGHFIATGHGKKTAGYALASRENGHFVLYQLKIKTARINGMVRSRGHTESVRIEHEIPYNTPDQIEYDPQILKA